MSSMKANVMTEQMHMAPNSAMSFEACSALRQESVGHGV
jgi:hypothetical protein